jgi:hypothetical protein
LQIIKKAEQFDMSSPWYGNYINSVKLQWQSRKIRGFGPENLTNGFTTPERKSRSSPSDNVAMVEIYYFDTLGSDDVPSGRRTTKNI